MHEAAWSVPDVANDLAKKYDLITIGDNATEELDIIKSSEWITEDNYDPRPNIKLKASQTTLGKQLINYDVEDTTDIGIRKINFANNVKVLYNISYSCPSLSKNYGTGQGIGLLNNTSTGKMWIHSSFLINDTETHVKLLRRLTEYILNNT